MDCHGIASRRRSNPLIIGNRISPAFFEAKFPVEIEGGHIFFLNKKNGLLAGTKGAVTEGLNQGSCITVAAIKRVSVYSANLNTVDSDCVSVSLCYNVSVQSQGKTKLIFKNLAQGDVNFGICEGAARDGNFFFHVVLLQRMQDFHIVLSAADYFFATG